MLASLAAAARPDRARGRAVRGARRTRRTAIQLLPLPLPPIDPAPEPGAFRRSLGARPTSGCCSSSAGSTTYKGLDILIEAVEPLLGDGTTLAVVGRDDGQLDELRSRFASLFADGRVRFVGPLYGDERFAAYADADVFCLTPPHWEETSVAALEAAACGTPVVLTEQAEIPGIEAAGGGFVVPLETAAIRAAVAAALETPTRWATPRATHVLAQHATEVAVVAGSSRTCSPLSRR